MQSWSTVGETFQRSVSQVYKMISNGECLIPGANNRGHIGMEREVVLIDAEARAYPIGSEFIATDTLGRSKPEILQHNVESCLPPLEIRPGVWKELESSAQFELSRLQSWARSRGARVVGCGIVPSLREYDLQDARMSSAPRYRELVDSVAEYHGDGGVREIFLDGDEPVRLTQQSFCGIGASTADQPHLPVNPRKLGWTLNFVHGLLGASVALAANSTYCFGQLTKANSRIDLYHSTVCRDKPHLLWFPEKWFPDDVSAYLDWCQYFIDRQKPAFVSIPEEVWGDPVGFVRYQLGTAWPWVRLVVDRDPALHVRMELRPFCAQASSKDLVGLCALIYGALRYAEQRELRVQMFLTPADAKHNFETACRFGMEDIARTEDRLRWKGGAVQPRELLGEIYGWAEAGLIGDGFDKDEINETLRGVREMIFDRRKNPAEWMRSSVISLRKAGCPEPEIGTKIASSIADMMEKPDCPSVAAWAEVSA